MAERRQTALGAARARFIEGLPRKAREVRASLALLTGTPAEDRPREELRRRLHALYASAQVFRIEELADELRGALEKIDDVRAERRAFAQEELDTLARLAATIPRLGGDPESETPTISGMTSPGLTPAEAELIATTPPRSARPRMTASYETVVSVLLVDQPESQAHVRAALPPERFELMLAADADEALRLARSSAPDVVLADPTLIGPGTELVSRLREDPLTDFVPVVLLLPPGSRLDPIRVRESGADEALVKPFDADALLRTVSRLTDTLGGAAGASTITGDLTVEEIAEYLGEEVKRGLVEAAGQGKDIAIPLGDGTPVLAAVWSAIGRVRAHVAERSGGRVRFRESPRRGGPAFVTVSNTEEADADGLSVDLAGRRAIVVDDDPAVVWFFAGLLREHGADVVEAGDGLEALEEARKRRPDLIISDILMPRLDGFGLTRALGRDPTLSDVPVILISWKEDFLSRMRELQAGAKGYLRKEAGTAQILSAVREALMPRARLEQRLRAGGDVRGRLEDVGMHTLLTTVAAERPDARVTVRDAGSLFEAELRSGDLADITRTASDGMFNRGRAVLRAALGTRTARYTVADAEGDVRRSIAQPLGDVLTEEMADLAAHVDAVSGKNLSKAARIVLNDEAANTIARGSPEQVQKVVEAIREGRGPRQLLLQGEFDPRALEEVLVDLARKGAISDVRGVDGADRVALARAARDEGLHPTLTEHEEKGTLSWLPPPSKQLEIRAQAEQDRANELVSALVAEESDDEPIDDGEIEDELESLRPPPSIMSESEPPPLDEPFGEPLDLDEDALVEHLATPNPMAFSEEITLDVHEDDLRREDFERAKTASTPERDADVEASDDAPALRLPPSVAMEEEEPDALAVAPRRVEDEGSIPPPKPRKKKKKRRKKKTPSAEPTAELDDDTSVEATPEPIEDQKRKAAAARETVPTPQPDESEGGVGLVGWALALLLLGALGFVGYRLVAPPPAPPEPALPHPEVAQPEVPQPETPSPTEVPDAREVPSEQPEPSIPAPPAWGREARGTTFDGVDVAPGQGLLVMESGPAPMQVSIGEREFDVGDAPVGLALDPGVHHVAILRGDDHAFLWVAVREGHTRFAPAPP
ncbi:MAG: response regulator [Sandaracinaceae bacterium]